jgi:endonuclease/exonuclease/phosphatase family metal-dependent hydrolase
VGSIRAVSFNILHGQVADGGAVDVAALGRSAAALRPDLLALQEVDVGVPRSRLVDEAAAVAQATGLPMVFGKAARVGGIGKYGNALLARGAIEDVAVLALPRAARSNEPRSAVLARVTIPELGGEAVSVAATHLSIHRPEVHDQLQVVVDELAARPLPRLLIGDLNLESHEVAPVVEKAGMALAGGGPTFPRSAPRIRIDHVAVAGLVIGSVEVVATGTSDHAALVVEVSLP